MTVAIRPKKRKMDRDFRRDFGARLRHAREQSGFTIRALAEKLGVTHVHVCNAEHGRQCYALDRLPALAAALGVSVGWLVTGREEG